MTDKVVPAGLRERFRDAAVTMFKSHGYENVTAAQIAAAAGVTERTFFRYFPDKREVLFGGEDVVRDAVLAGLLQAPEQLGPLDALFYAYGAFVPTVEATRKYARPRQDLIDAHPALQERDLAKIAKLADAIAEGLQERGIDAIPAALTARIGMAAIAQATKQWLADDSIALADRLREARDMLRLLAG